MLNHEYGMTNNESRMTKGRTDGVSVVRVDRPRCPSPLPPFVNRSQKARYSSFVIRYSLIPLPHSCCPADAFPPISPVVHRLFPE
jgi:hypothetical protein